MVHRTDTVAYLDKFSALMTRYMGLSIYTLGLIGAICNMRVFSRSSLRSNPCCIFLLALNIVDLLHLNNSLLIRIAQYGFHWDPSAFSSLVCQIRYYIGYVLITLFVILITLASCERYASTCKRDTYWRRLSRTQPVCFAIFGCVLICCAVCLFVFSCYDVNETSLCVLWKGGCTTTSIVYTFVVIGFVPPVLIATFTSLTLRNLRVLRYRSRSAPISYKNYVRIKQANDQLTSMLFMQITAMFVSSFPYALLMIYQLSARNVSKSPLRIAWEQLIAQFIHLLIYINYVCTAYINLATSPIYRRHLLSTGTEIRSELAPGIEIVTSMLLSISRAEHTTTVPSMTVSSTETIGHTQHQSRTVRAHVISPQQTSSKIDCVMISIP